MTFRTMLTTSICGSRVSGGQKMFRAGMLSYTGGLALLVMLLIASALLRKLGVSFSEALYLSALGLVVISYGVTEWRLRRGR